MSSSRHNRTQTVIRQMMVWPRVFSIGLSMIALVVTASCFIGVSSAARAATDNTEIPGNVLGIPLFVGFHVNGHFGVHVQWGVLLMLLVPAAVGLTMMIITLVRSRRDA